MNKNPLSEIAKEMSALFLTPIHNSTPEKIIYLF